MLNEFTKKEAPVQGLAGLGGGVPSRLLTLASGEVTYVDDVFSTFLWDGTGSTQTITNGIDLAGEGGMVWTKGREVSENHMIHDSERGKTGSYYDALQTNVTNADYTDAPYGPTSFNSNGFTLGGDNAQFNGNGDGSYCSWTFRKCPGFFDIQTYTGNGTGGLNISHDLGSVPGFIIVKSTSLTEGWFCYHRSLGNTKMIALNGSGAAGTATQYWNDTTPTDSVFTVGTDSAVNSNGATYVAYLFAHNDGSFGEDSDEAVIKCGSYTGNASATGVLQDLGFEPQWVLIKRTDSTENWQLVDNMRGVVTGGNDQHLEPNVTAQEQDNEMIQFEATGFRPMSSDSKTNGSSANYIYIAIRRPHKPPETGTDVLAIDTLSVSSANTPSYSANFPVDLAIRRNNITSSDSFEFCTRISNSLLYADSSTGEADGGSTFLDFFAFNNGWATSAGADSNDYLWMLKRAPGFFDVLIDNSTTSVARTLNHNLGAAPEFILAKRRGASTGHWYADQVNYYLRLNTNDGNLGTPVFNTFTSTQFSIDAGTFSSGESWAVYLFASLAGISKVGSYTGTGSNIDVDCGFTAGARFVLIKRTDSTGDWYVWDTARGIVAGNDPHLLLNSAAAEVTSTDYIDPLNSGFTVTSSAPAALNTSGGTYIFLAIA